MKKDKPIDVAIYEFNMKMSELINNSGIPTCIIEYLLRDLLNEVSSVTAIQRDKNLKEFYAEETKEE